MPGGLLDDFNSFAEAQRNAYRMANMVFNRINFPSLEYNILFFILPSSPSVMFNELLCHVSCDTS